MARKKNRKKRQPKPVSPDTVFSEVEDAFFSAVPETPAGGSGSRAAAPPPGDAAVAAARAADEEMGAGGEDASPPSTPAPHAGLDSASPRAQAGVIHGEAATSPASGGAEQGPVQEGGEDQPAVVEAGSATEPSAGPQDGGDGESADLAEGPSGEDASRDEDLPVMPASGDGIPSVGGAHEGPVGEEVEVYESDLFDSREEDTLEQMSDEDLEVDAFEEQPPGAIDALDDEAALAALAAEPDGEVGDQDGLPGPLGGGAGGAAGAPELEETAGAQDVAPSSALAEGASLSGRVEEEDDGRETPETGGDVPGHPGVSKDDRQAEAQEDVVVLTEVIDAVVPGEEESIEPPPIAPDQDETERAPESHRGVHSAPGDEETTLPEEALSALAD